MTFKNIRIKMKSGKSRTQRVKVLASGKYKFVKNLSKRTSRTRKRSNPTRRKGARKMTRRKKRRSSRKMTIPIAAVGGALAGATVIPAVSAGGRMSIIENMRTVRDPQWMLETLIENYTGIDYSGNWNIMNARGLWAAIGGILAHKAASYLGVNRALGRAKIPIIRI